MFFSDPPSALPSGSRADSDTATGLGDADVGVSEPKLDVALGSDAASSSSGAKSSLATDSVPVSSAHSRPGTAADTYRDCVFLSIDGTDLPLGGTGRPATGFGFGPKFGTSDLKGLSRRSGHSLPKLQEALGTLKEYRIKDCLLQRSTFMPPTGTYE